MLQNKNAIIYGAGGSIGGSIARAFANAGARVFLAGRNLDHSKRWLMIYVLQVAGPRLTGWIH
jgi:NAD(P)-dependent dehydrogenase (short-subunit alcohol dehydrogenase family)